MLISDSEKHYCHQSIQQDVRLDGRTCQDFRPVELELGLIAQASGSARVHLGGTDVLVGVKVEVGAPAAERPDQGRLAASVECSACASPDFEGRGGEEWGMRLARALEASLLGGPPGKGAAIDLTTLGLIRSKACWVLYLDGLVLNDNGNVLDALSICARAALANTRIPKVEISAGDEDEPEIELDDDPSSSTPLDVSAVPIIVTVSQVGAQAVLDMTAMEEPAASSAMHIGVNQKGQVCGITQEGSKGVDPAMWQVMVESAQKTGPKIIQKMDEFLRTAGRG